MNRDVQPRVWQSVVGATLSCAVLIAVVLFQWISLFGGASLTVFTDLDWYRRGLAAVLAGHPLYDALGYPPFALLAIAGLGGLPVLVGNQVWTAVSIVLGVFLAFVVTRKAMETSGKVAGRADLITRCAANATLLLMSVPMTSQISNGQLSLFVLALVFIDVAGVVPRQWRGTMTGLAGAIKVTPLIFIPHYVITGQRREAAVATGTFLAATAVGFALFPSDSLAFWTQLGRSEQFGDVTRSDNWSIRSALARLVPQFAGTSAIWIALAVVVLIASMWRARQRYRNGDDLGAAFIVAAAATVAAPIAWPHYFIWLPLIAVWLMTRSDGLRGWRGIGPGLVIYLCYSPILFSLVLPLLAKVSSAFAPLLEIVVLVPILIAFLGLPGQSGVRREVGPQSA